jgi:phosphate/sulfate permease
MFDLSTGLSIMLIVCLLAACLFEFINGFHDTANAVATVIYTKSLSPGRAVVWSGIWNFIGVYFGGIAVAVGIINLLPIEALVDQNVYHNIAMILSLILTAVIWNLGTWYFGIPASSSHTLIGSIFGIGIAFMFITPEGTVALNWLKVAEVGLSLLVSPFIGFFMAMVLMFVFKKMIKKPRFFKEADKNKKPPFWIRSVLILTSTCVSFSHGSNDGQKGVGLVMIILIGMLPAYFALDPNRNPADLVGNIQVIEHYICKIDTTGLSNSNLAKYHRIDAGIKNMKKIVTSTTVYSGISKENKFEVRKDILSISSLSNKLLKSDEVQQKKLFQLSNKEMDIFKLNMKEMKTYTEFAPWWVLLMISLSLALGTMIGWKRIVTTIGEKIGKNHLSYAQGASSGIIAASTIWISSLLGLPVSTTHVLSSGIAGSMVSEGGLKNLQYNTIKNILIAWIVTIPVTITLACLLFLASRWLVDYAL